MARTSTITDRVLEGVRLTPDCRLDDLVLNCQDFTWQEVFLEVNRLNRIGQLELTSRGLGAFTIRVAERELAGRHIESNCLRTRRWAALGEVLWQNTRPGRSLLLKERGRNRIGLWRTCWLTAQTFLGATIYQNFIG